MGPVVDGAVLEVGVAGVPHSYDTVAMVRGENVSSAVGPYVPDPVV